VVSAASFPDSEAITYVNTELERGERVLTNNAHLSLYYRTDVVSSSPREPQEVWETEDEASLLAAFETYGVGYVLVFKSDLETAPVSDLPLFSQPDFYEQHGALLNETARTYLYEINPSGQDG
jgi:hypothetical protein